LPILQKPDIAAGEAYGNRLLSRMKGREEQNCRPRNPHSGVVKSRISKYRAIFRLKTRRKQDGGGSGILPGQGFAGYSDFSGGTIDVCLSKKLDLSSHRRMEKRLLNL
jgi:hypothetical protein